MEGVKSDSLNPELGSDTYYLCYLKPRWDQITYIL